MSDKYRDDFEKPGTFVLPSIRTRGRVVALTPGGQAPWLLTQSFFTRCRAAM